MALNWTEEEDKEGCTVFVALSKWHDDRAQFEYRITVTAPGVFYVGGTPEITDGIRGEFYDLPNAKAVCQIAEDSDV